MERGRWSRRAILVAAAAGGSAALASAVGDTDGNVYGGLMALTQAYNVANNLWIGPDSAKSTVSADSGRVYMASDTQVEYYGDGGSWVKLGVGSSSEPVPSVTTENLSINSWEEVDVVERGVDNTGSSSAVSDIQSLVTDNRLLVFPDGDYLIDGEIVADDVHNFGFVAKGNATFTVSGDIGGGTPAYIFSLGQTTEVDRVLIKGFEIDMGNSGSGDGGGIVAAEITEYGKIADIRVIGRSDNPEASFFVPNPNSDEGKVVLEGVRTVANANGDVGSTFDTGTGSGSRPVGILVQSSATGRVLVENCHMEAMPNNGYYMNGGDITVVNSTAKNCSGSNFRVHDGVTYLGCKSTHDSNPWSVDDSNIVYRGIHFFDGLGEVINCSVEQKYLTSSVGVVFAGDSNNAGWGTLENVDVSTTVSAQALNVKDHSMSGEKRVRIVGGSLSTTADGSSNDFLAIVNRKMTVVRDLTIEAVVGGATDRKGMNVGGSADDSIVDGATFNSDNVPLQVQGVADVKVRDPRDLTTNGSVDLYVRSTSTDTRVQGFANPSSVINDGTRTRWDGIIAGGPLGGTGIGSLTGASEGDLARSDGTNASASADELFILKSGGDWQSIADPSTTITPS